MELLTSIFSNMTVINNMLLLAFFFTFAVVFWKEHRDAKSPFAWTDLLMLNGKVSLTKLGQFWGIAISSWVTIYMTQKLSADQIATMFPWIFGTWLTFLVASNGMKAFAPTKKEETTSEEIK